MLHLMSALTQLAPFKPRQLLFRECASCIATIHNRFWVGFIWHSQTKGGFKQLIALGLFVTVETVQDKAGRIKIVPLQVPEPVDFPRIGSDKNMCSLFVLILTI